MKTQLAAAAVALVALSTTVEAADLPSRNAPPVFVPPPPVFSWTGVYVGALAGAASQRTDIVTTIDPGTHLGVPANLAAVAAAGTSTTTRTDAVVGGEAGYNAQFGSLVVGVEGDATYLGGDLSVVRGGTLTTGDTFTVATAVRQSFLATARGRVGFALDRALFFVTGGAAFTDRRLTQTYTDTLLAATGTLTTRGPTFGFAVGGGIEYALADAWSVKAEYLYSRFGAFNSNYTIVSTTGSNNLLHVSAGREDLHIGRVGLNYRFGTTAPVVARY